MKRITAFGLMTLALAATLLIGAGDWNNDRNIDPHSHENIPFAVVKSASGANNIQFGELTYGSERYLVVINADCDNAVSSTKTISLTLCPGPGRYRVDIFKVVLQSGNPVLDSTGIGPNNTNTSGELPSFDVTLGRGQAALIHIDPVTPTSSFQLTLNYKKATYAVNGRKIAIDKFGRVHVCYTDSLDEDDNPSVWYAVSDDEGSTWQKQKVADNAYVPTIGVDTFGVPWVSYMTTDQRNLYLWSEGYYERIMHVSSGHEISNAPAVALDFDQSVGVVYYSSRNTKEMDMIAFELPSVKKLYAKTTTESFGIGPISCCIGNPLGSGVAVAGCGNQYWHEQGLFRYYKKFVKQLDWHLNPRQHLPPPFDIFEHEYSTGECVDPSIGNQGYKGYCAWAVYYHPSLHTIRYKKAGWAFYPFPDGNGDLIANMADNCYASSVQIADGMPIVVWENCDYNHSASKIYYTYLMPGDGTSWSTPKRVSSTDTAIIERYPHVDFDYDSKKVYVIWTQYGGGTSTSIGGEVITYESLGWDSVQVIHPNGMPGITGTPWSEGYPVGQLLQVTWELKSESNPDSSRVYANFDYPGGSWDYLETTEDDATVYDWYPQKTSDSCRVKVEVYYASGHPYDISDENFRIVGFYIGPQPWPAIVSGEVPSNILSTGGFKTIQWQASSFNGLDTTQLQVTVNGGGSFSFVADSCVYDSTLTDTVVSGSDTLYCYEYNGTTYWTTPATPM